MIKLFNNFFKDEETDEDIRKRVLNLTGVDIEEYDKSNRWYVPPMDARIALNELCIHLMGNEYYYNNYRSHLPLQMTREEHNAVLLFDIESKSRRYIPSNKIFKYKKDSEDIINDRIKSISKYDDSFIKSISDQKAINEICDHLLGEDWYVVDPLSTAEVNTIIVYEIELKYKRVK